MLCYTCGSGAIYCGLCDVDEYHKVNGLCSVCGEKGAREYKKIPLPNGHKGHISLRKWTSFCPECLKKESAKFAAIVESSLKGEMGNENVNRTRTADEAFV